MLTKKAKLEQYDEVARQRGLLERYFWDSRCTDMRPDAKSRYRTQDGDVFVFYLYHTAKAHGGYIVVEQGDSVPSIEWWDVFADRIARLGGDYSQWALAMRQGLADLKHVLYVKTLDAETRRDMADTTSAETRVP